MTQCTADFELGTLGAHVLAADAGSATAWNAKTVAGSATIKYDDTHVYGALSAKCDSSGGDVTYLTWNAALGTVSNHYGRLYAWLGAVPTFYQEFLAVYTSGGTVRCGYFYITPAGKIALYDGVASLGATGSVTVAAGQWIRIEWMMINSTTVGQMEVKLFHSADSTTPTETITTAANKNTRANSDTVHIGNSYTSIPGYIYYLDNIVAGAVSYPGPFVAASTFIPQAILVG